MSEQAGTTISNQADPTQTPPLPTNPPAGGGVTPPKAFFEDPAVVTGLEPEALQWLGNKKYATAADAIKAAHGLEKLLGADKAGRAIVVPEAVDNIEQLAPIFDRLGRPKDATGYDFGLKEGDDPTVSQALAPVMHKAGVTKAQAKVLAEGYNEVVANFDAKIEADVRAEVANQQAALKTEWGAQHDDNVKLAQLTASKLGMSKEQMAKIEGAVGYAELLKLFHRVGTQIIDPELIGGADSTGGDGMPNTLADMEAFKLKFLQSDEYKAYLNGDPKVAKDVKDKAAKVLDAIEKRLYLLRQKPGA